MKRLLLLILLPLLIASCGTPRERAERLVKRANNIYPIDSLVSEKLRIDTLLQYDTTVVIEKDTAFVSIPQVDEEGDKITYNKTKVVDNKRATVWATTNSKGGLDLEFLFKKQNIQVKGVVRYNKEIITHRKVITITYAKKGFFYWTGVASCGILVGAVAIYLILLAKRRIK